LCPEKIVMNSAKCTKGLTKAAEQMKTMKSKHLHAGGLFRCTRAKIIIQITS
jgi:hypothetical protein